MKQNTMSQNVKDILKILTETVMPTLARTENRLNSVEVRLGSVEERLDRSEKKLDMVAEAVTVNQKTTNDRLRIVENKLGIYHD